jgi:hypothetical protein
MNLCEYKNIFGKPNTGVHSYRIFDIAIVDVVLTILLSYFISFYYKISFFYTTLLMFLLGIVLHRLFCVKTTIDKLIFGE